jgi:2,3-bisphosphoglycerate-dependent phosphoglycerate mutase
MISIKSLIPLLLLFCASVHGFSFRRHHFSVFSLNVKTSTDAEDIGKQDSFTPPPKLKQFVVEGYEGYSRYLSPKEEKRQVMTELEQDIPLWRKAVRKLAPGRKTKPGALILLRCCESTYNLNHTFTGWLDPRLSERGIKQSQHAGRLLVAEGFDPDVVYTSRLQRSITTAWHVLEITDSLFIPVCKTYRLNQRMYGALEGLSQEETATEFGANVVHAWRQSLKARPPPLSRDDPSHPVHDRRYADVPEDRIPDTESLLECQERARPLWDHQIRKDIKHGKTVLIVAHRDSLRGLVKVIDGINDKDILDIDIPKGVPIVYRFDNEMNPLEPDDTSLSQVYTTGVFLEKPGNLKEALDEDAERSALIRVDGHVNKREYTLKESMMKLRDEDIVSADRVQMRSYTEPDKLNEERWSDDPCEFEEYDVFESEIEDLVDKPLPTIVPLSKDSTKQSRQGPFVVLIRHGRTPHNNMQLFTGWEDPPLADEGVEDAKNAGRILKRHGFEFDVVYTSCLTRAIQTAYYSIEELDQVWLPIIKSWRLNERMYGDLTGKSKKMIANQYGEDQLKKWRRGYTIRPPPVSSYSLRYPGNDERRSKHFKDLRFSVRETMNRSFEKRKFSPHRKFPKTESLKDCMDRSIPFYTKRIREEAVDKGKRVLITSHENAIRGILMHLCDIPEEAMNQLHLPNGLPLVYDVKGRCITLLDDGSGQDPMEAHDFGPAAKYLFKPCELDDSFFEEMELVGAKV